MRKLSLIIAVTSLVVGAAAGHPTKAQTQEVGVASVAPLDLTSLGAAGKAVAHRF